MRARLDKTTCTPVRNKIVLYTLAVLLVGKTCTISQTGEDDCTTGTSCDDDMCSKEVEEVYIPALQCTHY